jgi:Zn-dependent protease/CBS domain-containing protein
LDRRGFRLFRLAGIDVTIDASWLIVFALVAWGVSGGYLPSRYPGQSPAVYLAAGLVTAVLFFASVLAHEFCHSLVARAAGMEVKGITLFLFGGVSQIAEESGDPGTEFRVAVVGPLCSVVLAGVFWALHRLWAAPESVAGVVLGYLGWINLALGVFNLVPGFPLDGGRVLRAVVWWRTGSFTRATRVAANAGKGFAVLLMALGGWQMLTGNLVGGLWFLLIGGFLRSTAEAGYRETLMRKALEGVRVGEVMVEDVLCVTPDLPLDQLIRDYVLHHGYKGYPVVEAGRVVGIVTLEGVRQIREAERATTAVRDVMAPVADSLRISPEASLADALRTMTATGSSRVLVLQGEKLAGLVTKSGLVRFVEIKRILEA